MGEQVAAYYDPKTQERQPARLGAAGCAETDPGARVDARAAGSGGRRREMGARGREGGRHAAARSAGVCRRGGAGGAPVRHRRARRRRSGSITRSRPSARTCLPLPSSSMPCAPPWATARIRRSSRQAPMFLKESLLMPYTFGLDFVRTVLANAARTRPLPVILHDPPIDRPADHAAGDLPVAPGGRGADGPRSGCAGRARLQARRFRKHGRVRRLFAGQAIRRQRYAELLPALARRILLRDPAQGCAEGADRDAVLLQAGTRRRRRAILPSFTWTICPSATATKFNGPQAAPSRPAARG